MREGALEVEVLAQLGREERREPVDVDATRQEVRLPCAELPRARARQQEAEATRHLVEDDLDDVEERRHALHLVEEDGPRRPGSRPELFLEALRPGDVLAEGARRGEIQREIGPQEVQERGLADLTRSHQQHAAAAFAQHGEEEAFVPAGKVAAFLPTCECDSPTLRTSRLTPAACRSTFIEHIRYR